MAHLGFDRNEYGTLVSVHQCDICGNEFTVCPPIMKDEGGWDGCQSEGCKSYDSDRDVDDIFDSMMAASDAGSRPTPKG